MLTWQLPVKRSPISIYKISNGQFSFWVKTFANTDCLQKKFHPSSCFFGRSPSNWHHVHQVCYDALAVMRKIGSLQIWSGDYDLFSHSTRTLGCDQLLTWTSCLQYSANKPLTAVPGRGNRGQRPKFWSAKNLHSCGGVYAQHCAKLPCATGPCSTLLAPTAPPQKTLPGLEIKSIELSTTITWPPAPHRWTRWVGLKLLCFVLLPSAAMLFRPHTQRCCCPSGNPKVGLGHCSAQKCTKMQTDSEAIIYCAIIWIYNVNVFCLLWLSNIKAERDPRRISGKQ